MDIAYIKNLLSSLTDDYIAEAKGEKPSKRWLQDFNEEIREIKSYRGREILELLQNADDARSDSVTISLDTAQRVLRISNSGPRTEPFTAEGVESIMFANLSPKRGPGLIGAKGLGFRSVLNWATTVEVVSGNAKIGFDSNFVKSFWENQMRPWVNDAKDYERQAQDNGRQVPIAILTMPEIAEISPVESTTISLSYNPDREALIIKDLTEFNAKSLLFLHNIKSIAIFIDGKSVAWHENKIKTDNGEIVVSELMGRDWAIAKDSGKVKVGNEHKCYEVACAFCLTDSEQNNNEPIYDFFPTRVPFGLPCLLHATLELDSSRNSLIQESANNHAVIKKLTSVVWRIAEYIKTQRNSWDAYALMRPWIASANGSEYIQELYDGLTKTAGNYVPTLGAGYVKPEACNYYSDPLFDFIRRYRQGKECFPNMRLRIPDRLRIVMPDTFGPHDEEPIESFANGLGRDYESLATFIVELSAYATSKNRSLNCHIFLDANDNVIKGRTYINGGDKVESIPSFLEFNYINEKLERALKARMNLRSGHPEQERDMASKLSCVGDISSSDITYVIRNILPKKEASYWPAEKQRELLACLFDIYRTRQKDFAIGDVKVYLPTEAEPEWTPADKLVLSDSRFPDGFANLNTGYEYDRIRCGLFPEFLLTEDVTPIEIQDFMVALGASLYVCKERIPFSWEYLRYLKVPPYVLENCIDKDREKRNYADIADMSLLSELSLNSLINLLLCPKSDCYNDVCGGQMIHWYKNRYQQPEKVALSFAAYLLRTQTRARELAYYTLEDKEWLPGMKPEDIEPFGSDYRTKQLLEALGAKKYLSDFSPEELYEAVIRKAACLHPPYKNTGVQMFYHKIKQALDSKDKLEIPVSLPMLCTVGESIEIRESREIFYSDNNSLPEEFVKKLPLLMMNSREGELSVKRCFGCRSFKDVVMQFTAPPIENAMVTEELQKKMMGLSPYLLAFVSEASGSKGGDELLNNKAKNALLKLNIRIVASCRYSCAVASEWPGDYGLNEGNLIYVDETPVICTRSETLSDALENPGFCNAVVEAVCIALQLSVKENGDRFYRLLRSSQPELDYIQRYEIDAELWQSCQAAFGLSDADFDFWRKVFSANHRDFDSEKIKIWKSCYISECLGIAADRANRRNFNEYHKQQLRSERNKYVAAYKIWLHEQSAGTLDKQKQYLVKVVDFQSDDWIEAAFREWNDRFDVSPDYSKYVIGEIKGRFEFDPEEFRPGNASVPAPENYNVNGLELNMEDESLRYFEGHEEYFANLRAKHHCDMTAGEEVNEPESKAGREEAEIEISISIVDTQRRQGGAATGPGKRRGRVHTGKKLSDYDLTKIGDEAEDKVLNALRSPDSGYEVGAIFSEHLNPASGKNAQGYDLEYRRKGDSLFRCLEIKHFAGESIIMSRHEYETARSDSYKDRYDVALVNGNEIQIWENAFSDESKYAVKSDDYIISFQIASKTRIK